MIELKAMPSPPTRGTAPEWVFRKSGTSLSLNLDENFIKVGTNTMFKNRAKKNPRMIFMMRFLSLNC